MTSRKPVIAAIVVATLVTATYLLWRKPVKPASSPDATSEPDNSFGELNFSLFVYQDINRSGTYDTGDRPYAGQPVALDAPDQQTYTANSNIAGFANFSMSRGHLQKPIRTAGNYRFSVSPADGWQITSNNASQQIAFEQRDAAPAGLNAISAPASVGVAPLLTVGGQVADYEASEPEAVELLFSGVDGQRNNVDVDAAGVFSHVVKPGLWTVMLRKNDQLISRRQLQVDRYPAHLSNSLTTATAAEENPDRIDFEDLTNSDTLHKIPSGYRGLNWNNWIATHHKFYQGYGYINATVSGEYIAYNSSGHPASISADTPFDFVGGHIGVAWPEAEPGVITIRAWRGQNLAYEDRIRATIKGALWFQADYTDITRLEFSTEDYWQVVVDDLLVRIK